MGVPLNHPFWIGTFHIINHPANVDAPPNPTVNLRLHTSSLQHFGPIFFVWEVGLQLGQLWFMTRSTMATMKDL